MENMVINKSFWSGKKVFITGDTGFKGTWLSLWLVKLGANVIGFSLEEENRKSFISEEVDYENYKGDIRDYEFLKKIIYLTKPEIIIHLAAQPIVQKSYTDPIETYSTNIMGTVNLLEIARECKSVVSLLNVTTDKCYENKEWHWGYREYEPMGGHDPYSCSKGCSELISSSYRRSFFDENNKRLATARAGNVIGGGDWAENRIVPDAVRAFIGNEKLLIRNPMAIRPWQHVLDPIAGYILLSQKLFESKEYAEAWNFGPNNEDAKPVSIVANILVKYWGGNASWSLDNNKYPHEANYLKLDCSKSISKLGWKPVWNLSQALHQCVDWYKAWNNNSNITNF